MNTHAHVAFVTTSPQKASQSETYFDGLKKIFSNEITNWTCRNYSDVNSFMKVLEIDPVPHVTLIDTESVGLSESPKLIKFLRSSDQAAAIIALCSNPESSQEIMRWMDFGATGVMNQNKNAFLVNDALREALTHRLVAHKTRSVRVEARQQVKLKINSMEQALVTETMNIGLGGMFLRFVPANTKIGDNIAFEIVFTDVLSDLQATDVSDPMVQKLNAEIQTHSDGFSISGIGRVAWIRTSPQGNIPEGMGIQFGDLHKSALDFVQKFVGARKRHSYIPMS